MGRTWSKEFRDRWLTYVFCIGIFGRARQEGLIDGEEYIQCLAKLRKKYRDVWERLHITDAGR
jgi:hypothetical protein